MTPIVELIARKRDGGELSADEIEQLIPAYLSGEVDDAQMAALLMAGVLRGFSDEEAGALTRALVDSGRSIDLSTLVGPTVDKHSTGGVGDATTLVVGPMLAASGCQVAKLSGRGLGHTGGTLDKLEAIPGLDVDLTAHRLLAQVERVGIAIAAAGPDLAPADRRLYALRDVTATVEDPALIAASVMSKKLAGGAGHVLLDVKVGRGAFMPDLGAGRALAERCVAIGRAHGRATAALLTQMDEPLADSVGNALEVAEAVAVLRGDREGRLASLSVALTSAMLHLTGIEMDEADRRARLVLRDSRALEVFREMIEAQGGAGAIVDEPWAYLPRAPVIQDWMSSPGVVHEVHARRLGEIARGLGAGRQRLGDRIDHAVGLEVLVRRGQRVDANEPTVRIHARTHAQAQAAAASLSRAVRVGEESCESLPMLLGEVGLGRLPAM